MALGRLPCARPNSVGNSIQTSSMPLLKGWRGTPRQFPWAAVGSAWCVFGYLVGCLLAAAHPRVAFRDRFCSVRAYGDCTWDSCQSQNTVLKRPFSDGFLLHLSAGKSFYGRHEVCVYAVRFGISEDPTARSTFMLSTTLKTPGMCPQQLRQICHS